MRADRDLEAVVELVSAARPLPDIAVFHAQQAAEKALKAFLVAKRRQFARTHDLVALLADCVALEPRFTEYLAAAQTLSPYATRFRYPSPGVPTEPSIAEADTAVELARSLLTFVRGCIGKINSSQASES